MFVCLCFVLFFVCLFVCFLVSFSTFFADDHTILRPIFSDSDHDVLQNGIDNIFQWTLLILDKVPSNLSKCSVMHMTHSKLPNHRNTYIMGERKFDEVNKLKLLGVTFSKRSIF